MITLIVILSVVLTAVLSLGSLIVTLYGLYLAFKTNLVLGILVFLLPPSALVLGVLALFGKKDVSNQIATWIKL